MCGRYSSTRGPGDLAAEFEAEWEASADAGPDHAADVDAPNPSYNVAPTDTVYTVRVRHSSAARVLEPMRWGLIPSWADDVTVGSRMFNARAETLTTSGAFKKAAAVRRCLVPADGWYEWAKRPDSPKKQAYYLTRPAGVALAGVYEFWKAPKTDAWVVSCSIITVASAGELAEIHDRMPLALPDERWTTWLDPGMPDPTPMLDPSAELLRSLEIRPVGSAVGNVANNGPDLQRPDKPAADTPATLF